MLPHGSNRFAKKIDVDFVVSAGMLPLLILPSGVHVLDRGEHTLNGIERPLKVVSLARGETSAGQLRTDRAA